MKNARAITRKLPDYNKSVFINCPFDNNYKPLFKAIIFTCYACGYTPRCSLEESNEPFRIIQIIKLINDCGLGIHDISIESARMNMPYELGLFMGCQLLGDDKQKEKSVLVLEHTKYASKKYLSDASGMDIEAHNNEEKQAIVHVRNWLSKKAGDSFTVPSFEKINEHYELFTKLLPEFCERIPWNPEKLEFHEFAALMEGYFKHDKHEPETVQEIIEKVLIKNKFDK